MPRSIADDLVIETLALGEAELRERAASLEGDVAAYRAVLVGALAGWLETLDERDRLRHQNERLRADTAARQGRQAA